jgi:sugar lactone lactonase YvrE
MVVYRSVMLPRFNVTNACLCGEEARFLFVPSSRFHQSSRFHLVANCTYFYTNSVDMFFKIL